MNYRGHDINTAATPRPWGAREEQCWKDTLDSLYEDTVTGTIATALGHHHYRIYSETSNNVTLTIDTNSFIGINCVPDARWDTDFDCVMEFLGVDGQTNHAISTYNELLYISSGVYYDDTDTQWESESVHSFHRMIRGQGSSWEIMSRGFGIAEGGVVDWTANTVNRLMVDGGVIGTIINYNQGDYDTIIRSDTKAEAFFLDGATGYIGLGTAPNANWNTNYESLIEFDASSNVNPFIYADDTQINYGFNYYVNGAGNQIQITNNPSWRILNSATPDYDISYAAAIGAGANITGLLYSRLRITDTELVINDNQRDFDFRVESDGDTHALFVDASSGFVSLSTTPSTWQTGAGVLEMRPDDTYGSLSLAKRGTEGHVAHNCFYDNAQARWETIVNAKAENIILNGGTYRLRTCNTTAPDTAITWVEQLRGTLTELIVNEYGIDLDFRVETDDNINAFFVEGAAYQVGVGTNDPLDNVGSADGDFSAYGHGLHIVTDDTAEMAFLILEGEGLLDGGTLPANGLLMCDQNGGADDKMMILGNGGGIAGFHSLDDDQSSGWNWNVQNILVMDMGSGRIGVGTDSPDPIGYSHMMEIVKSAGHGGLALSTFSTSTAHGAMLDFRKSATNTIHGNTIVANNEFLGNIRFIGNDGNDFNNDAANIIVQVDGVPGNNDVPGRIMFFTHESGGGLGVDERMRIANDGGIFMYNLKSGANQGAAGAAADEVFYNTTTNALDLGT